jgi:hypothetical protein
MNSEKPEHYGLEPAPSKDAGAMNPASSTTQPKKPDLERPHGAAPEPIRLEDESATEKPLRERSVKELDVCPNCGASMRGEDTLVCLRCGFDLKTNRVVQTVTGEVAPEQLEQREAIVKPGMGELWLPGIMAALAGIFMLIAYLGGWRGVFTSIDAAIIAGEHSAEISLSERFGGLLRFIVLTLMWSACAVGGLAFVAQLAGFRFINQLSDLKLAAARMLGITAIARIITILNMHPSIEWPAEALLQLAAFAGLSILLFRLNPRDGLILAVSTLCLFVALWASAFAVVWAAGA